MLKNINKKQSCQVVVLSTETESFGAFLFVENTHDKRWLVQKKRHTASFLWKVRKFLLPLVHFLLRLCDESGCGILATQSKCETTRKCEHSYEAGEDGVHILC